MDFDYHLYTALKLYQKALTKITGQRIIPTKVAGKRVLDANKINKIIYEQIKNEKPFFVGRYGGFELQMMIEYINYFNRGVQININGDTVFHLINNTGFFPKDLKSIEKFANLMIKSSANIDVLGRWWNGYENYIIKRYANQCLLTNLLWLEPWYPNVTVPWSSALEGKNVLVIHPFADTIKSQYKRRNDIFPGSSILPQFTLHILKAVQTSAGQRDSRFKNWFEALDYMYREAMKINFDVAIIGCGSYGFPLASMIKSAGKQAIHLGGSVQVLFGIKGKRWDEQPDFEYIRRWYNDAWVYPRLDEKPNGAKNIENGCYW